LKNHRLDPSARGEYDALASVLMSSRWVHEMAEVIGNPLA
jgi:hypothetical protein